MLNQGQRLKDRSVSRRLAKGALIALSVAALGAAGLSGAMAQDGDGAYPGGDSSVIFGEGWPFPEGGGELIVDDWPFPNIPAPGSGGGGGTSVGGSGGGDINVGGSSGGSITMGGGGEGISVGGGSSGSGSGGGSGNGVYG